MPPIAESPASSAAHGDLPSVLTVAETAKVLRLSRNHVYDLIRGGQLPALHIGRTVRIPRDRLIAWISGGTHGE